MTATVRVYVRARQDRRHLQLYWRDPLTGKPRTKSAGTADWKEAERAAARWESELQQRHGIIPTGWELFRARFEDEHLSQLRPGTRTTYTTALNHFERIVGAPRQLDGITANVLSDFRGRLQRESLSPETVNKIMRHVKAALKWAESIGMLSRAPACKIPRQKVSSRGRAITTIEFCAMLRQVDAPHYRDLLLCLWLSGLRLREALQLSDQPPVQFDPSGEYPLFRIAPEGQKSARLDLVPVTPACARFLRRFAGRPGPYFPVPHTWTEVSRTISRYGRQAGISVSPTKYASAHDLRRSFGHRWALRVHPLVLQRLMRHRTLSTTLTYYVHLDATQIASEVWTDVHRYVHRPRP